MKQPKFRGYSLETNTWHYGHGWCEVDYTDDYKKEKGLTDKALLYTNESPIECELSSMGQFTGETVRDKDIYEGDSIEVHKLTFESSSPLPETLDVHYYGGMYQLFRGEKALMGLHLLYLVDGEIIGNVFENQRSLSTPNKVPLP